MLDTHIPVLQYIVNHSAKNGWNNYEVKVKDKVYLVEAHFENHKLHCSDGAAVIINEKPLYFFLFGVHVSEDYFWNSKYFVDNFVD